jgi:hypothetical protein
MLGSFMAEVLKRPKRWSLKLIINSRKKSINLYSIYIATFLLIFQLNFELEIRHQDVQEHFTPTGPVSSLDLPNHLIPTFCISHDIIKKFMTGQEVFFQIDLKLTLIKSNKNSENEES